MRRQGSRELADEVTEALSVEEDARWYGAYDHVTLAQLFGSMADLPAGVPMWTNDVRQLAAHLGVESLEEDVPMAGTVHNALDDARWVRDTHGYLMRLPSTAGRG